MTTAKRVQQIDWSTWAPRERATLVFIVRGERVLLIKKKRGLGAGKINGPGGRIDDGETPLKCAIREVREELRVTPVNAREVGTLRFQFADGFSIFVHVFIASGCDGEPRETDEATPMWTHVDAIPYDAMWEDDRHWLPMMLDGVRFDGRFIFDGDRMLDYELRRPS